MIEMILTGERVKNSSSLAALLVHCRRPPSLGTKQVGDLVQWRTSLGADLVKPLAGCWPGCRRSISILRLRLLVLCAIQLDGIRRRLPSLLERINVLNRLVGCRVKGHCEDDTSYTIVM